MQGIEPPPHLQNKVIIFKYLQRLEITDGIAKLNTWAYVQQNPFLGQGGKTDKILFSRCSKSP